MARQVRDLVFKAVYEPDMSRMVKALRIPVKLLERGEVRKDGTKNPGGGHNA